MPRRAFGGRTRCPRSPRALWVLPAKPAAVSAVHEASVTASKLENMPRVISGSTEEVDFARPRESS